MDPGFITRSEFHRYMGFEPVITASDFSETNKCPRKQLLSYSPLRGSCRFITVGFHSAAAVLWSTHSWDVSLNRIGIQADVLPCVLPQRSILKIWEKLQHQNARPLYCNFPISLPDRDSDRITPDFRLVGDARAEAVDSPSYRGQPLLSSTMLVFSSVRP